VPTIQALWWVGWRKLLLRASAFGLVARGSVDADSLVSGSRCSRQTQHIAFTDDVQDVTISCNPLAIESGYRRPGLSFAFESFDHVIHQESLSARVFPIVISRLRSRSCLRVELSQ